MSKLEPLQNRTIAKFQMMSVLVTSFARGFRPKIYIGLNNTFVHEADWNMTFKEILLYCEYYFTYGEAPVHLKFVTDKNNSSAVAGKTQLDNKMMELWRIIQDQINAFGKNANLQGSPCIELNYYRTDPKH